MQLALVALFALVLAPTLCDAQAVRRASPEEPSGRKRGRPGGPSHQVQRPSKYEHNDEPDHKPINGEVCEPMKTCYTDHECAAEFPCTKTECVLEPHHLFKLGYKNAVPSGMGVCVCFENKPEDTPCIGDENDVCQGPLGKCDDAGVCIPQPDDDGCPCADKCTVPPDACVDPDFNCICEGGACVVNYLPAGVSCDPSTTDALKQCQEATCVKKSALVGGTSEVLCEVENRPDGTACSGDDVGTETTCENAGKCAGGMCLDLQCENPEPAECTTLGDVCYDTSFGQGLCCLDLDDFSGPLQCVKEDRCPCGKCSQDGFDDNTAYCAFNAGNDETACTASCRSCDPKGPLPSVGSVFDEKACNNANSCDSISGVNVYCPQGQICVACKPANTQSAKPEGCQAA
jgi:hypothetical protein